MKSLERHKQQWKQTETIHLPFSIPQAVTSPIMELDWMHRLGIDKYTQNSAIKFHNIQMDEIEKIIPFEERIHSPIL